MAPESDNESNSNSGGRIAALSSNSSIDSVQDIWIGSRSEDLDKLSICLSEVPNEDADSRKNTLYSEIVQAQLAFWTLIISITYTYAWQQHRKKFLFFLIIVVPLEAVVCCTMSTLLTIIVIMSRLSLTPFGFDHVLKFAGSSDDKDTNEMSASRSNLAVANGGTSGSNAHSLVNGASNIKRTISGNEADQYARAYQSSANLMPFRRSGSSSNNFRSSSYEDLVLPPPVCRKHSGHYVYNSGMNSTRGSQKFTYFHSCLQQSKSNPLPGSKGSSIDSVKEGEEDGKRDDEDREEDDKE